MNEPLSLVAILGERMAAVGLLYGEGGEGGGGRCRLRQTHVHAFRLVDFQGAGMRENSNGVYAARLLSG